MKGLPTPLRRRSALRSGAAAVAGPLLAACASERAAVKLTRQGDPTIYGTDGGNWRNWVYSNGADFVDAALSRLTLDQPAAVEAMQLFQDFRYRYKCATTPQDNAAQPAIQRFIAGGLAFYAGVRSAGNVAGFARPDVVGIAQHPRGRGGRRFQNIGNGVAVVQPNRLPDLSYQAATWFVSAEFQKLYYKARVGGVVVRLSVLQSEEYLTSVLPQEWNEFFARGVTGLMSPPKLSNWPEISATLDRELGGFLNGEETAAAATARIAPQIDGMLRDAVRG